MPVTTPASVPVLVETIAFDGTDASIDALALVGNSGETVPASLEVAQVDITGVTNNDDAPDASFDLKPAPNKNHDDADDVDDDDVDDDDDADVTISGKQASFNCSFLFQSSTSNPSLADELNGSYDLSFNSAKLFTNQGILTTNPTQILRMILSTILEYQATATGCEALVPSSFDLSIPSRASIVNVITSNLPFKAHNGRSITLIQSTQSLQQGLAVA